MSTETMTTETPDTTSMVDEFQAGFDADGMEPTTTPAPEPTAEEPSKADTTPEGVEPVVEPPSEPDWKVKATELEASLTSLRNDANGRMGALKQWVQQQLAQMVLPKTQGKGRKVTKEHLSELAEEYPELADRIASGLSRVMEDESSGTFDSEQLKTLVSQEVRQIITQREMDDLAELRPDWQTVVGPEGSKTPFRDWLDTQPKAYADKVASTRRASVLAQALQKFDDDTKPKPAEPPAAKPSPKAVRQNQLAAAVPMKRASGTPPPPASEDPWVQGFNED